MKFLIAVFVLLGTMSLYGVCTSISLNNYYLTKTPLQQSEAQQAIDSAQDAINTAYTHVQTADAAGAQISDLISTLNTAIRDLNQARTAYDATNYGQAITLATNAENNATIVTSEAQNRGYSATLQIQVQIIATIAVVVIVIVVLYFVITRWQRYRQQQKREFLQMRIHLPEDDQEATT
ncbi:MAG: AC78 family protein [Candidatus Hermodarchaeota archaeon]|nr:AC78 family protein [Candidatus Hermodarchaeota archaeon]